MNRRLAFFVPLALFAGLALFLAANLGRPTQTVVESHMMGKPVPPFRLPALDPAAPGLDSAMLRRGRPVVLNLFASWCVPCAVEAPWLKALAADGVPIIGIAIQDEPAATSAFLARHGNPYAQVLSDRDGRMLVLLGASGVPESFIVDGRGIIRHQHLGDVREADVAPLAARFLAAR
jgi:cytochrome c biogenesis protein CcmG/thiol:disulfide interchange protein DsbE